MFKIIIVSCVVCAHSVQSLPMEKTEAMTYLKKYGYMPMNEAKSFQAAMMDFQNFMGLPETGEMDDKSDEVMRSPRCGVPDMTPEYPGRRNRRYALQGSKWKYKKLTYKVVQYSKKIHYRTVDYQLKKSFSMWSTYTNIQFIRKYVGNADILIGFYNGDHNDGSPFDGEGGVLAHAFSPVYGGDIHFDNAESWQNARKTSFHYISLHEIGHSLGLQHSKVEEAVMFPHYYAYVKHPKLHRDDVAGIRRLYRRNY